MVSFGESGVTRTGTPTKWIAAGRRDAGHFASPRTENASKEKWRAHERAEGNARIQASRFTRRTSRGRRRRGGGTGVCRAGQRLYRPPARLERPRSGGALGSEPRQRLGPDGRADDAMVG